jgi:hypothetical protein
MRLRIRGRSDQADQAQDGKNNDHEANEINDAAHVHAPFYSD